mgnify:CR=1 FL=1
MDIYTKDKQLKQISSQKKKNRNNIIIGLSELSKIKNNNTFLEKVYNDYKEYYENTVEIKKKQIIQIENIINYLEKYIEETEISNSLLKQIKHAQKNMLTILNEVHDDLENIEALKK